MGATVMYVCTHGEPTPRHVRSLHCSLDEHKLLYLNCYVNGDGHGIQNHYGMFARIEEVTL